MPQSFSRFCIWFYMCHLCSAGGWSLVKQTRKCRRECTSTLTHRQRGSSGCRRSSLSTNWSLLTTSATNTVSWVPIFFVGWDWWRVLFKILMVSSCYSDESYNFLLVLSHQVNESISAQSRNTKWAIFI